MWILDWFFPDKTLKILENDNWKKFGNTYYKNGIKISKINGYYQMQYRDLDEVTIDINIKNERDIGFHLMVLKKKLHELEKKILEISRKY